MHKREEIDAPQAEGNLPADLRWHVAIKRGKLKQMPEGRYKELITALERAKAQVRARVEHPFHVVKNLFHYKKARYKGIAKNKAQLFSLFALANLVIAKKPLLALPARGAT